MKLIDTPDNLFHDGDKQIGTKGTKLSAEWFNHVQEEMVGILVNAGIEPDPSKKDQVLDALKKRFVGQDDNGDVAISGNVSIGGKPLSEWCADEFQSGENSNGWWEILPDGTIFQGGTRGGFVGGASFPADITFPIMFPGKCESFVATAGVMATDYGPSLRADKASLSYGQPTQSGIEGQIFLDNNTSHARQLSWLAKGK